MLSFEQVKKNLQKGQIKSFYVLHGENAYLEENFQQSLQQAFLGEDVQDGQLLRFTLDETALSDVIIEANTLSFFSARKILWLQKPEMLAAGKKLPKATAQAFLDYLAAPNPDVIMVFVFHEKKPDKRKKAVKTLLKAAEEVELAIKNKQAACALLQKQAEAWGSRLTSSGAQALYERTKADISEAMAALEKLCLLAMGETEITAQMVTTLVPPSLDDNIFNLLTYLLNNQGEEALQLFRHLLAQKQAPLAILALLQSNFRLFIQLLSLRRAGIEPQGMARLLKAHPYRVKMSWQEAQHFSLQELIARYLSLVELDYQIKTGQIDQELGLEWFMLDCLKEAQP